MAERTSAGENEARLASSPSTALAAGPQRYVVWPLTLSVFHPRTEPALVPTAHFLHHGLGCSLWQARLGTMPLPSRLAARRQEVVAALPLDGQAGPNSPAPAPPHGRYLILILHHVSLSQRPVSLHLSDLFDPSIVFVCGGCFCIVFPLFPAVPALSSALRLAWQSWPPTPVETRPSCSQSPVQTARSRPKGSCSSFLVLGHTILSPLSLASNSMVLVALYEISGHSCLPE